MDADVRRNKDHISDNWRSTTDEVDEVLDDEAVEDLLRSEGNVPDSTEDLDDDDMSVRSGGKGKQKMVRKL